MIKKRHIRDRIKKDFENMLKELNLDRNILNKQNSELYFFDRAMEQLKKREYEIALILFCSIIEGIAKKRKYKEYKDFYWWISKNKDLSELCASKSPKEQFNKWYKKYKMTYGAFRGFRNIILKSYERKNLPDFTKYKHRALDKTSSTIIPVKNKYEQKKNLTEFINKVYSNYRSPFTHELKIFCSSDYISSTISSNINLFGDGININLLAEITLNVIKKAKSLKKD